MIQLNERVDRLERNQETTTDKTQITLFYTILLNNQDYDFSFPNKDVDHIIKDFKTRAYARGQS